MACSMGSRFILNFGTYGICTFSYPRISSSLLLEMPYPAFKIQRYERKYSIYTYSKFCITGKQNSFIYLILGRDLVSSAVCISGTSRSYFTLKPCVIIRTNLLELCSELTICRFANIIQKLYSHNQNYI
jgi:hypothetical protein